MGNKKRQTSFLITCLPFDAVIRLYGSSNLYAKQKWPFYIYEYASQNPGVWIAKNPDFIGVFREHIFFMFLLWWRRGGLNPLYYSINPVYIALFKISCCISCCIFILDKLFISAFINYEIPRIH